MLTRVTITGIDGLTNMNEVESLTKEFPFVEWGVLLSPSSQGKTPRFPGVHTLEGVRNRPNLPWSGHLCGRHVQTILNGYAWVEREIVPWPVFRRIQINTHGQRYWFNKEGLANVLRKNLDKEFIFQYDNVNGKLLEAMDEMGVKNYSTLFDLSHGAGVLPEEWPKPIEGVSCGYAGGISPENIKDQIKKVLSVAGDRPFWMDMETHVRTNEVLDMDKVRQCLEISAPFITKT